MNDGKDPERDESAGIETPLAADQPLADGVTAASDVASATHSTDPQPAPGVGSGQRPAVVDEGTGGDQTRITSVDVMSEADAKRLAFIRANDADVEREVRRLSRRGFLAAAVAGGAAVAGWRWLGSRPREAGQPWPLRRALELNEKIALGWFRDSRLSPRFAPSAITRPSRINGGFGLDANYDVASWRLRIEGARSPVEWTLDELRRLPRRVQITELRCIEGWSIVVQWAGVRLSDVIAAAPPATDARYVALETPDRGYYVGLDMKSAMHPQTLLAYEMNGEPLTWQHGAPLRLAIPVKYGVKNIKRVGTIRYTSVRPADYWAERGYDWYVGH